MCLALNGWQRLWVVLSVLLLGLFSLVVSLELPVEDRKVVEQLQSPECKPYRTFPDGYILAEEPKWGEPCWDLQFYQAYHKVNLHNVEQYKQHLRGERAKIVVSYLTGWLAFIAVIYLFGFAVAWVRRGFRSKHA